jgi:hypothetical protein
MTNRSDVQTGNAEVDTGMGLTEEEKALFDLLHNLEEDYGWLKDTIVEHEKSLDWERARLEAKKSQIRALAKTLNVKYENPDQFVPTAENR